MPISICKHGAPFVVQHENRYGSGASQSSSLSKSIRHISNSHEEIKFISCYSANGACFSNAQMLANASGRPVIGYYGKINKLTASLDNSGRIFRPQHKLAANICYVGNRLLSAPVQLGFGLKHLLTCHSMVMSDKVSCHVLPGIAIPHPTDMGAQFFPQSLLWEVLPSFHALANQHFIKA